MNLQSAKSSFFLVAFLLGVAAVNGQCSNLYEQCGGTGWGGATCCSQPTPDGFHVKRYGVDPNVCKKLNEGYSQCVTRCPQHKPCFISQTQQCTSSDDGLNYGTDGRGRQYCGTFTYCTDSDVCFDETFSCTCGGDGPCARGTRPGGCTGLAEIPGSDGCGGGTRHRCPAWDSEQCGGIGFVGPKTCQPGLECVRLNEYYSSCQK